MYVYKYIKKYCVIYRSLGHVCTYCYVDIKLMCASNVYMNAYKLLLACMYICMYVHTIIFWELNIPMGLCIYIWTCIFTKIFCNWKIITITLMWCHTLKKNQFFGSENFIVKNHANTGRYFFFNLTVTKWANLLKFDLKNHMNIIELSSVFMVNSPWSSIIVAKWVKVDFFFCGALKKGIFLRSNVVNSPR